MKISPSNENIIPTLEYDLNYMTLLDFVSFLREGDII